MTAHSVSQTCSVCGDPVVCHNQNYHWHESKVQEQRPNEACLHKHTKDTPHYSYEWCSDCGAIRGYAQDMGEWERPHDMPRMEDASPWAEPVDEAAMQAIAKKTAHRFVNDNNPDDGGVNTSAIEILVDVFEEVRAIERARLRKAWWREHTPKADAG